MLPTLINGRWELRLPEHRHARPEWPWWEATRLAAMRHVIRSSDVVFDIGAEEGDFPALFASWGASVVCFEPNDRVWPNIRAIFQANDLRLYGWFRGFASDDVANVQLGPMSGDIGHGFAWPPCADGPVIGDHGFQTIPEYPDVPRITVDAYCAATGHRPDVLTLDVEGAEFRVLSGARDTLVTWRPVVFASIHPEFMRDTYGDTPAHIETLMADVGYESRFLCRDHEEHWVFWHPDGRRFP